MENVVFRMAFLLENWNKVLKKTNTSPLFCYSYFTYYLLHSRLYFYWYIFLLIDFIESSGQQSKQYTCSKVRVHPIWKFCSRCRNSSFTVSYFRQRLLEWILTKLAQLASFLAVRWTVLMLWIEGKKGVRGWY